MEDFTVLEKIGQGNFGVVYLVYSRRDPGYSVIKQINLRNLSSAEKGNVFQETQLLSSLKHPSIVQYKESFQENGFINIVMEHCAGGDLYTLINRRRGVYFQESLILNFFAQICSAVLFIHKR
ncbi:serine/threonine-protein kinase Nek1 isoform X2 [Eurytemora carolleeae]|uniref:serine/threonine-protein kinase Nek1 isoform X2 n=1 Tax=Eurytemora carolleeae TaxID=1294199 RepID=UPI000C770C8F|nr:serine/threonine-protein kinase Nek1 isoform X2 [Eurytemora carolleeae]|eukprot:XP_023337152.1 serine/threonine-protein kinase Nek1-like isoform X2 [Eurytemora affinis]